MDKKDRASAPGNFLVPISEQGIVRRSCSLIGRGLRDLDAAEQTHVNHVVLLEEDRDGLGIFERLDCIHLGYARATADSELPGFWRTGDEFTIFLGDLEPDGDDFGGGYMLDAFLVGKDDHDFWDEVGEPAALTQERLRDVIRKFRPKLLEGQWPGKINKRVAYPSASRIFVGAELFSSRRHNITLGLAIWSTPTGADVEIDGRFVGDTESGVEVAITTGEHSVVLRKAGYETWSRQLNVRVPDDWSN